MSRSLLAFVLVAALPALAASQTDTATQTEQAKVSHWPLKAGNAWHYQATGGGKQFPMIFEVAKIEVIDGQSLARVECRINGKVAASEHLSLTDKGLFRHRFNGIEASPPVQLLKYPIKEGESWEMDVKIGGDTLKGTCTIGSDEVTVPAGKYKTVTVDLDGKSGAGVAVKTKYWLAPGVGMVKQSIEVLGTAIVLELEKFEAAK